MARSRSRSRSRGRRSPGRSRARFVRRLLVPAVVSAVLAWRKRKLDENERRFGAS